MGRELSTYVNTVVDGLRTDYPQWSERINPVASLAPKIADKNLVIQVGTSDHTPEHNGYQMQMNFRAYVSLLYRPDRSNRWDADPQDILASFAAWAGHKVFAGGQLATDLEMVWEPLQQPGHSRGWVSWADVLLIQAQIEYLDDDGRETPLSPIIRREDIGPPPPTVEGADVTVESVRAIPRIRASN